MNTNKENTLDSLLLTIAQKFIYVTPSEIDNSILEALKLMAEFSQSDRAFIYQLKQNNKQLLLTHQYCTPGIKSKIERHDRVDSADFLWLIESIKRGKVVKIASIDQLPSRAATMKMIMQVERTQSTLLFGMFFNEDLLGFVGMDIVLNRKKWSENCNFLLTKNAELITGAINRKKAVERGLRNEQRYRTLFTRIKDVAFRSTPRGKFLEINPAGLELFAYDSLQDISQIDIAKDLFINPDDKKRYSRKLDKEGHIKEYELNLKTKDGREVVVLETSYVLRDENGQVVAYEGIMRDVTEKYQLEQQLIQSQKMESIGLLAGGIAHDFNNILTAINGYAEMLSGELDEQTKAYKLTKSVISGGKRAENLVRQLLAFSRKQVISTKVIDINVVISELHKMLRRLIAEDISLLIKLSDNIKFIKADPVQVQQILVNLIVNAGHAIKKQDKRSTSGKIVISTEQVVLDTVFLQRYPGSREGTYILITVTDNGIGIGDVTRHKIFEPFFTTKKEDEGTGLGLSTVYGIVKQNDGNIYVDSATGKGASFKIYWPVSEEDERTDAEIEKDVVYKADNKTILVVEDDYDVRDLACSALESFGYKVYSATNGVEALDLINEKKIGDTIDLVLTDIVMPEMRGDELAEKLRELKPDLKIILSSGYSDSQTFIKEIQGMNGCYYLAKPYSLKKLETRIGSILSK